MTMVSETFEQNVVKYTKSIFRVKHVISASLTALIATLSRGLMFEYTLDEKLAQGFILFLFAWLFISITDRTGHYIIMFLDLYFNRQSLKFDTNEKLYPKLLKIVEEMQTKFEKLENRIK